jgi:Mg-chelatase subunit ChlD
MPAPTLTAEELLAETEREYGVSKRDLGLAEEDEEEAELALLRRFLFAPPGRQLTSGERHGLPLDRVHKQLRSLLTMLDGRAVDIGYSDPACTDNQRIYLPKAMPAPEEPDADLLLFQAAGLIQLGFSRHGLLSDRRVLGELYRDWVLRSSYHLLATRYTLRRWSREFPGLGERLKQVPLLEKAGRLRVNLTEVPREGLPDAFIPLYDGLVVCLNWRPPGPDGAMAREAIRAVDDFEGPGIAAVLLGQAQRLREHFRRLRLGPPPLPFYVGIIRPEWILSDLARDLAAENEWKKGNKPLRQLIDAMARRGQAPEIGPAAAPDAPRQGLRARLLAKLSGPPVESNAPAYGKLRDEAQTAAREVRYGAAAWSTGADPAALVEGEVPRPDEDGGRAWDEWDDTAGVYRFEATKVFTPEAATGPLGSYERIVGANGPQIKQIRRRFEALRVDERWVTGQPDGSEVDLNRAILAVTDIAAGQTPDDRIFRRFIRSKQEVAILTMVDLSGSTQGHVIHLEQVAVVLFSEGLRMLNFPHAFYGFGNTHPMDCQLSRIKGFDEPYGEPVYKRLSNLRPNGATRMGAFIRHASWLLAQRPESRRILMIVSDGKPEDRAEYRGRYGIRDTAMAVAEARRLGVHVFCISIDPEEAAERYLTEIFGAGRFLKLDDMDALPLRLPEVFRDLVH